jgi:septum formation protein
VSAPAIVLASGSPRRRDLLAALGLDFEVRPAEVDESPLPGESSAELVARLSWIKASTVASVRPGALVIAADTVVVLDGEVLSKPVDAAENRTFIARLAGRRHRVLTGHTLMLGGRCAGEVCRTEVEFRPLDAAEIERYIASGEGLDKAGGYGIQGLGASLVPRIEGCYFNVVGLSLATVVACASRLGVALV